MAGIFRVCSTRTVHCWKRETLRIPTMYRTPAAEVIPPSFCHITFFHGTSHLHSGSDNECMHDCSHWVNHQSGWLEIYSFLQTPRACGQLSTCGFFPRVGRISVHPPKYTVCVETSSQARGVCPLPNEPTILSKPTVWEFR